MTDQTIADALAAFDRAIGKTAIEPYKALQELNDATVGARLFTVMTVDMEKELAGRVYTSHPQDYPVSGTKPIHYDDWFDTVHKQRRPFVANTIKDIAKVFFDHETIWSLGCGSVINLPIEIGGMLVCTVNLLDTEHYYTEERVARAVATLLMPAKLAYLATERRAGRI
jgi:hypothetical protein